MNQTKKSFWTVTKVALLLMILTTIFYNFFLGVVVWIAIKLWASRNDPVENIPVEDVSSAFGDSYPLEMGSRSWNVFDSRDD